MVVVQLMGGLGNQLFQVAAGIALAEQKQQALAFHFDDRYQYAKRNFALEPFNIEYLSASLQALSKYLPKRGLKRRLNQLMMLPVNGKIYREPQQFRFDPEFFHLPSEVYLSGFWQSYKYTEHYSSKLRDALTFKSDPVGKNLELLQQIQSSKNSVSLHFRRGDYALPQSGFYILPLRYYENALQRLEAHLGVLDLFVFSDDQDWVKKEFKTRHPITFVDHNDGATAHADLRLMAACAHNVIANSSLSWWGAYLNTNKHKQVFVPQVWNTALKVADTELIPPDWMTVQI